MDSEPSTVEMETTPAEPISDDRLKLFKTSLHKAFRDAREQSMSLTKITDYINKDNETAVFTPSEISSAVEKMTDDNQIMVADEIVFLI